MAMLARVTLPQPDEWVQLDASDVLTSGHEYQLQSRCGERAYFYIGAAPSDTGFEVIDPYQRVHLIYDGVPVWGKCPTLPGAFAVWDKGSPPALDSSVQELTKAVQQQSAITGSVWYDPTVNPPVFYVRRETMNEDSGTITVSWETPGGQSVTPPNVDALVTVSNAQNIQPESSVYTATANGTGYVAGDILIHAFGIDSTARPPTLAYTIWFNATQGQVMAQAPASGTFVLPTYSVAVSNFPQNLAQEDGGNLDAIAAGIGAPQNSPWGGGVAPGSLVAILKAMAIILNEPLNIRNLQAQHDSVLVQGITNPVTVQIDETTATPALSSASGPGTVAAGASQVSFFNSGTAAATVAGGSLPPGIGWSVDAPAGGSLAAIAYDATGTTLLIGVA